MEVVILPDPTAVASLGAGLIAKLVHDNPSTVLGLATGGTMKGVYAELVRLHREGLDFSGVTSFNLDEYVGLPQDDPHSYRAFMQAELFDHVPFKATYVPDGLARDVPEHCRWYEQQIYQAGGIQLQLLGLGPDAHIGFNEPTSSLASRTRIKTLDDSTVQANQRFFEGAEVPRHVITMGVGTIIESRHCLVLAFGAGKADAVAAMVEGPITAMRPASVLQMHPKVTLLVDEEASTQLTMRDYFRSVYDNKPAWQGLA